MTPGLVFVYIPVDGDKRKGSFYIRLWYTTSGTGMNIRPLRLDLLTSTGNFGTYVSSPIPAVGHFDEPVPRSRLRGQSEKNTDELPLFVRRRRDARSIPSSTNHQMQWPTWTMCSEYQYFLGTKGINMAFDTYMNNTVH